MNYTDKELKGFLRTVEYAFLEMHAQAEWGGKEDYEGETQELFDMFESAFRPLEESFK
mgnify:CR=1 FL=1